MRTIQIIERVLARVDRKQQPWFNLFSSSNSSSGWESIWSSNAKGKFAENKVDMAFYDHVHKYGRYAPFVRYLQRLHTLHLISTEQCVVNWIWVLLSTNNLTGIVNSTLNLKIYCTIHMLHRTLLDSGMTRSKYKDQTTSSIELTNQTQNDNIYKSQFRYGYYNLTQYVWYSSIFWILYKLLKLSQKYAS